MSDYTYGVGQELSFNTIIPNTDLTHTWDFGDGSPVSSDPSPTHIYSIPGTYIVSHNSRDFCGSCMSVSHSLDIVSSNITIRSLLLDKYTANVGDIVTATVIAQNLSQIYGTGTIVVRFNSEVVGTFNVTLNPNEEISYDVQKQVTTAGTINVCADNICTVLFVESNVHVQSITLDSNISTGNPILATISVLNTGNTESKTIQTTLTNSITIVIDERTISFPPGTTTYDVPITTTNLPNGVYTLCAENICKALSVAIPTETTGKLSISSSPSGAEIFVDNQSTSQYTNATITNLSPGDHTFTLTLAGYNSTTGTFTIIQGQTTYIYSALSTLTPTEGSISISTSPPGAEIWINNIRQVDSNNQPVTTPATITDLPAQSQPSSTSYDITLKLSGYLDYTTTVDISAGQTSYLQTSLVQEPILFGNVNFTTNPDGASIFIDNQLQSGKFTPTTITDIPIGNHTFLLRYPGRNDATGIITVIGGTTSYVFVDMSLVSPTKGSISISTNPQGADIYINDAIFQTKTPTTIDDLTPGIYTIILKKNGYNDYTTTISSIAGQTISINVTLIPKVITVTGLEFPWWLALGIGVGMFQYGKSKELKDIRELVFSEHSQHFKEPKSNSKGKVITLTKDEYKIK